MSTRLLIITHIPMLCSGSHLLLPEGFTLQIPKFLKLISLPSSLLYFSTEYLNVDVPQRPQIQYTQISLTTLIGH